MSPIKKTAERVGPYKSITLIGTSTESWEKAAQAVIHQASASLQDLRKAEIIEMDMQLEDGKILYYRAKVRVAFKYHTDFRDYRQDPSSFLSKENHPSFDGG